MRAFCRLRARTAGRTLPVLVLLAVAPSCSRTGTPGAFVPTSTAVVTAVAVPVTTVTTAPAPTTSPATSAAPRTTSPAVVVSRGNPSRRMVALTFDAGADTGFTAQILDTLAATGVAATFGLTGRWAEDNPDLVGRIAADGHQFLNHTYDHRSFTGVSAEPAVATAAARREQLERTETLLGGQARPWFRPPYGDYNASVNADVGAIGYRYNVLWSHDSLGWQGLSAAAITGRVLAAAQPGAIYLFHVGSASQDAAALPAIIAGLRTAGYQFGTVAQVIAD